MTIAFITAARIDLFHWRFKMIGISQTEHIPEVEIDLKSMIFLVSPADASQLPELSHNSENIHFEQNSLIILILMNVLVVIIH